MRLEKKGVGEAPGKNVARCGRLQSSTTGRQRIDDPLKIDERSVKNLHVTCSAVQRRALEFAREQGNGEFLYTQQWVAAEVLQACPVMNVNRLWGSSQSLPQKWHPHYLVDVLPMHNAVQTEHLSTWLAMFFRIL